MPEKIEMDLLQHLTRYQNRLTFELTEWMIEQFYQFPDDPKSNQAALLQGWVRLLVQSLIESVKSEEPEQVANFILVLREEGRDFFKADTWQAALDWLGTRCHHFLKIKALSSGLVSIPESGLIEISDEFTCPHKILAVRLNQLDLAFQAGSKELNSHRLLLVSLLQSDSVVNTRPASRFSCN